MEETAEGTTAEIAKLYQELKVESGEEDFRNLWILTQKAKEKWRSEPVAVRARMILRGLWGRYFQIRKFNGAKEMINELEGIIEQFLFSFTPKDVEIKIEYQDLLSVVVGDLEGDKDGAEMITQDMARLVKETKSVSVGLKVINARGLAYARQGDLPKSIRTFDEADKSYPEAAENPEARQFLANVTNNRG